MKTKLIIVAPLAFVAGDGAARVRRPLAPAGLQAVLALEVPTAQAGTPTVQLNSTGIGAVAARLLTQRVSIACVGGV